MSNNWVDDRTRKQLYSREHSKLSAVHQTKIQSLEPGDQKRDFLQFTFLIEKEARNDHQESFLCQIPSCPALIPSPGLQSLRFFLMDDSFVLDWQKIMVPLFQPSCYAVTKRNTNIRWEVSKKREDTFARSLVISLFCKAQAKIIQFDMVISDKPTRSIKIELMQLTN